MNLQGVVYYSYDIVLYCIVIISARNFKSNRNSLRADEALTCSISKSYDNLTINATSKSRSQPGYIMHLLLGSLSSFAFLFVLFLHALKY